MGYKEHFIAALAFTGILTFVLGFIVFFRNIKNKLYIIFSLYSLSISWWSLSQIGTVYGPTLESSWFWSRFEQVGVAFIPTFFLHFVVLLLDLRNKKWVLVFSYLLSTIFTVTIPFKLVVSHVSPKLSGLINYGDPGILYAPLIIFFDISVCYGLWKLFITYKNSTGLKRNQMKYLFWSSLIGYSGGIGNFTLNYNISIPFINPFGTYLIGLGQIGVGYAIIKYRLMDIRLAISNTAIFIAIYALVLGIPFFFGYKYHAWQISTWTMLVLATAGPFIYLYIQKHAEDQLLQEQRAYHAALRQASAGMGRIKDLDKLLNMIVYILTNTVKIEHAVVYIHDQAKKVYKLGAYKHRSNHAIFPQDFAQQQPAVDYLHKDHEPIVFEEIKQKALDYQDQQLLDVGAMMQKMEAALVVPIYIGDQLIALVGMGKKENDKLYTEDDLSVFSILANQAALAIENAQFYEDMKLTQQQLFQAEKMATIGTMADGLSHQINNRLHAMGFIAGDALDTIKLNKDLQMPDKIKEMIAGLERGLVRIQENVTQGGDVVQGLLKYTRKGESGLSAVDVDAVVTSAYEMAQFKIKTYQMDLVRDYDKNTLPKVKGNSTQLQEVFFNLIDNGYDAMVQRQNELKDPQFHPTLIIHAHVQGDFLQMVFEDNGIGVKGEDAQKLFTPFFTTKLSSKKGTGLGLYVIRKIIEENHGGKVEFVSKYGQGTQMKLLLPISL